MKHFIASYELNAALIGLNPSIEKDIKLIEQACTATLFMTNSPKSLRTLESLSNFDENILKLLESRNVLVSYEYLEFEENKIKKNIVLIRPNSLDVDDEEKIKKICDEYSVISFIKYLYQKELIFKDNYKKLGEQIYYNILFNDSINRSTILEMINRFESYSIEYYLQTLKINSKIINIILKNLMKTSKEIYDYYSHNKELTEEIKQYLIERNQYPLLYPIREDYRILYPFYKFLISIKENDQIEFIQTEMEYLLEAAIEICIRIANFLEPKREWKHSDINEIFILFSKHPSLHSEEAWPGLGKILEATEKLLILKDNLHEIRLDASISIFINEFLKNLNMNFDFYYVSLNNFEIPEKWIEIYNNIKFKSREEFFSIFINKLKENKELIIYESKSNVADKGYYLIYKFNIPRAFIINKNRRSFIHFVLKNLGYINGIYNFLIEDLDKKNIPDILKEEQQSLKKAILEWEKEQQKKQKKSLIQKFIEWILKIFKINVQPSNSTLENTTVISEKIQEIDKNKNIRKKIKTFKNYIPEYRLKKLPEKIEKAIEYIERQYNGLIWVDELSYILKYNDIERLNSLLYYDKDQRFIQIKVLHPIKPLFIRKENLLNPVWRKNIIEYLKNSSKLPHQVALLEYIMTLENEE